MKRLSAAVAWLGLGSVVALVSAANPEEDSVNNSGTFEVPEVMSAAPDPDLERVQDALESLLDSQPLAFKPDDSGLETRSEEMMTQAHRFLKDESWVKLDIVIRAAKGPEEVARRVALRRGRLLKNWLVARGMPAERIRVGVIMPSESAEKLKGVRVRPIHFFARR